LLAERAGADQRSDERSESLGLGRSQGGQFHPGQVPGLVLAHEINVDQADEASIA
jgi:hypothetical protein